MKTRLLVISTFLFGCICIQSWARGTPWENLSDDEKAVLQPFKDQWQDLPEHRRDNLKKRGKTLEIPNATRTPSI